MTDTPNPSQDEAPSAQTMGIEESNAHPSPGGFVVFAIVVGLAWVTYIVTRLVTTPSWVIDASIDESVDRAVVLDTMQGVAFGLTGIFVVVSLWKIVDALERDD